VISKVVPSSSTTPWTSRSSRPPGKRLTLSSDIAGLGGNTTFIKPTIEGVAFLKQNNRMTLGVRGQLEYIHAYAGTRDVPIFEKLFLGGEYSVRGFDLRTIGPSDWRRAWCWAATRACCSTSSRSSRWSGPVR
jgi:outer membrane protein assembly factor BamA